MSFIRGKVAIAAFLIITLLAGGVLGYVLIEGWTVGEALYMTVITLTTVGFSEVHPMSDMGRTFTVVFLVLALGTVGYSATTLIGVLFEGKILDAMKEKRMKARIRKLSNHFLICGYGDVGHEVVEELRRSGEKFVVIDQNEDLFGADDDPDILYVTGDAFEESVLSEAGIERARGLVTALHDDTANVFVVLTARQMNPDLIIVTKATDDATARKLQKAGADRVISPVQIAGRRMASSIIRPEIVEFLDIVVGQGRESLRLEQFPIGPRSPVVGKTLRETKIGENTGAIVLSIVGADRKARLNTSGRMTLSAVQLSEGDTIIALGNDEQLSDLTTFIGGPNRQVGRRRRAAPNGDRA